MTDGIAAMIRTRTRPRTLSTKDIAAAALDILHSEGPDALSLRRVGESLGTNHVAIYRRCGSFDGLLDICADYVAASLPTVPESVDWAVTTQMRFENVYDLWAEHADLILLMRGRAWNGLNMVSRFYEPVLSDLVQSGMSIAEAAKLMSTLYRLTIGSVIATKANRWSPGVGREAIKKLGIQNFPTLAAVIESNADDSDARESFSETLRTLITALGSRYMGSAS